MTAAAEACGVYGIPGSPASVALRRGEHGKVARIEVASDLFGGPDAETCILEGTQGLSTAKDVRVELPMFVPDGERPN